MSRLSQGLQERLVTGLWPGELSTRTHEVTNLRHDNITHYMNIHYQLHNCAWNLNIVVVQIDFLPVMSTKCPID